MVKLAIIGAGLMGTLHTKSLLGNFGVEITGVCDVNQDNAKKLAELTKTADCFFSIDDLINQCDFDAAIVATPDNLHTEAVIKCAKAKKAMMIEKPFATSVEDGKKMMEAIKQNKVSVQMAHLFRFLPIYMNAKNASNSGELGDILSTNFIMLNKLFVPTKMLSWSNNSSPSWFLLSHATDAIMWINNCRVKQISAVGVKQKLVSMGIDTYDLVKVTAVLENNCVSTFEANWIMPNSQPMTADVKLLISGTKGAITIDAACPMVNKITEDEYSTLGIFEYDLYGYYSGLRRNMVETFIRSVQNNTDMVTNEMDGYNALCVLEAIDRSMLQDGKKINVVY